MTEIIRLSEGGMHTKTALTMGFFDGVHAGHRKLISDVCFYAERHNLKSCVLTFSNHPMDILCPEKSPGLLTSFEERMKLISSIGPDFIALIEFTRQYADMSPEDFIEKILIGQMKASFVAIGGNNRFGKNASGTPEMLLCRPFSTSIISHEKYNEMTVSSTSIRKAVAEGRMPDAASMLSRPYSIRLSASEVKGIFHSEQKKIIPPDGTYEGLINGEKHIFAINSNNTGGSRIIGISCESIKEHKDADISFLRKIK